MDNPFLFDENNNIYYFNQNDCKMYLVVGDGAKEIDFFLNDDSKNNNVNNQIQNQVITQEKTVNGAPNQIIIDETDDFFIDTNNEEYQRILEIFKNNDKK